MSRWMPPARVMLAAMVLWVAFPTVGWAQDLLDVVYGDDAGAKHLVRVDSEGPRVVSSQTLSDADAVWARGSATSDGRFVMSLASELQTQFPEPFSIFFLVIRDLLTGDTIRIDRGRSFANFALHPRRTEIVWSNGGGPAVLDAAGWRPLGGCAYASAGSLSANGARAVYQCPSPFGYIVVDVDTGVVAADLGLSGGPYPVLSPDGLDVYDIVNGEVRRRSVATGAVVAQTPVPGEGANSIDTIHVHHRTGEVFVVGNGISVFDGASLALSRVQPTPWGGRTTVPSWVFDADRPRIYTTAYSQGRPGFWIVDSDTLQATFSALLPNSTWIPTVRRVPRPARPQQLAATVQGASVALTWTEGVSVAQTLRYVLEVGSAPGLNNIFSGLDVGLQTSFGASGVPPGTYYVRVRAGNYTGLGAPSNEVAVVVP